MSTDKNSSHISDKITLDTSKKFQKKEVIDKITFTTDVQVNIKGVIEVLTKIKNRSSFNRAKVITMVRFMNKGSVIHIVETDDIYLDGTLVSAFSPRKKSSIVKTLYSVMSFDNVSIDNPSVISDALKSMDALISKTASDLRRAKILGNNESPEVVTLVQKLQNLKKERMEKARKLEWEEKFKAVTIDIQHSAL